MITPDQTAALRQAHDNAESANKKLAEALQPYYSQSPGIFNEADPETMNFPEKLNAAIVLLALFEEGKIQYHDMTEADQKTLNEGFERISRTH